MIRTLIWFIYFWVYLVILFPVLLKAKKLDRAGRIAERDELVAKSVRNWARALVNLAGGTIVVDGESNVPKDGAVVFVSNHQGNFDIPILLGYISKPKAFISKIEVLKMPMIRSWMRLMQCAFMDRKDIRQSLRTINAAAESIKKGYSMVIFPEGTRSKGSQMREFKAGSFKLALKAGASIVPVTVDGSWRLLEAQGRMKPGTVHVTIHEAVPTAGLSREEAEALPDKIKAIIESGLVAKEIPVAHS
jgi:1-acyl-sn-glycerol-3-phosphate acyltransferase